MTLDARVAAKLGTLEPQVAILRSRWEGTPESNVIRELFRTKLQDLIDERTRKLRICTPEDLKTLQGEANGLELAIAILAAPVVT